MARSTKAKAKERAPRTKLDRPEDIVRLMQPKIGSIEQEQFWVVSVDVHNHLLACELIAMGTATSVDVHPRDVFRAAVRCNAIGIVCIHNHPSGDPTPSTHDIELTKRMRTAGDILGIPVVDHIVIAVDSFTSIATNLGDEF